jgi:hypothetical protein
MIECLFTVDYEIYGNGSGTLRELVYEPTKRLISIFRDWDSTFVLFPELLEFKKIEEYETDDELHQEGIEIGLHLHSWWLNAQPRNGGWFLDRDERNLCLLSSRRIEEIIREAIHYWRDLTGSPTLTPLSFRNGLWAMQPTAIVAGVLARFGVLVDSTVFKGGRIRDVGVDYRPSLKNGFYWRFREDVNSPDPSGVLLEVPIYTEMVPFWDMFGRTHLDLRKKAPSTGDGGSLGGRWSDFARFLYPRKLDFCRMSFRDLQTTMERLIRHDQRHPQTYKPIVVIGHSKDFVDFDTLRKFLDYLKRRGIGLTNFGGVLQRLQHRPDSGRVVEGGLRHGKEDGRAGVGLGRVPEDRKC